MNAIQKLITEGWRLCIRPDASDFITAKDGPGCISYNGHHGNCYIEGTATSWDDLEANLLESHARAIANGVIQPKTTEQFRLCGNCLTILPTGRWDLLMAGDDGTLVPFVRAPEGEPDPEALLRCPLCEHVYGDGDGTRELHRGHLADMEARRAELVRDNQRRESISIG